VEIVTLLVPGFNDSQRELEDMADFIRSVSPDIPWHVSAFRPQYKMTDRPATTASQVLSAVELGYDHGLHYVYGGNLPGLMEKYENTNCHNCGETLIERTGYLINQYRITNKGTCPDCETVIPGIWTNDSSRIRKSRYRFPRFL
jgi:pyruvate formate lyase activating enzyme